MDRIDIGPPAAVKVQVVFDGGPTGNPGEQPFIIHPKSTAEVTLKQICALFEIEDHYSHFGLYNNETGREVYSTGIVKDSDSLRLKPLPAQKFISRAEVIISKSPAMASKALKHLNDHFIILATSSNNYNVVGNKGTMVVDSVFVSPFLIETIVKVIITKPHFVDLLVRLVNFPKIRVALSSTFLGNARRAITPATFSPPSSSLPFSPSLAPPSPLPFAFPPPSQSPNISPSPSYTDLQFQEYGDSSISHSSSHEELSRIRAGMLGNSSNLDLQELEASACPPSPSSALLFSSFAYTSSVRAPTPFDQPNTQSKHSRDLGTRKLDVFTLVRDTLTNARLPTPFTDFFRYLLSDKMNEGIVTRCVLLLNCMLGIAELTVVWGDVDESDLAGLPSEITSSSNKPKPNLEVSGEFLEGSSYGVRSSGAANRYVAFKHGIRSAGIIEALTKYVLQENPIAPLRSAISGFHDHLLRPLDMLALGALDYRKHSHGKLLEQIWWAAFPNSTYPGHLADDWRFIGFRGNPFLTPSHTLISIHAFAHFARNNTKIFREILIEQSELSFSKKGFPLGALAAHLSSMLINFYQLGILRRDPRLIKYLFGPDPSELFYRLFNMLIVMMHDMWRRAGFSFAQFLQSVRIMKSILQRAHARDPPDLATLEGFIRQFIQEDFPENANSHPRILLKRSTFVLEDKEEEEEEGQNEYENPDIMNGSPRIYLREDELWRKKSDDGEDEDVDGAEKGNKKAINNNPRLERFFGEAPEEGYQFAPQPPNVKMVKLKRIFGESVEPNGSPGMDPEVKEYNKRYRDSLNEDEIKKLEVERAHRLHAFFGEWFDTTDANRTIKHTKKPSITSPDITDLVVIRKISMPPPKAPSSSSSLLSDAVPTIHLSVQPANDFSSSPDVSAPQTQTLSLSLNPLFSDSPCASPRSNPSSPRSNSPSPRNDVLEQSVVPELTITAPDSNVSPTESGSTSPASPPPELIISEHIDIKTSNESNNSTESFENEQIENKNNNNNNNNNNNENNNENNNNYNEHDTHDKHVDYSDTGSSSSTPVIHPSPILSPLGRLSSTPASEDYSSSPPSSFSSPSTSPPASIASMASVSMSLPSLPMMPSSLIPHTSSSPPVSRSHNKGADNNNNPWRPALNRTTSAPLNNAGNRSRAGAKRFETAIGTRNHNPLHHLRNDETASSSSIADDTASYISNTDIEIGDDTRPRSNSGGKLSFFRLSRWFSKSGNDSSRPPSPSSNKRLKRNILKQLFGDRINKDLTDLMNEPSIQHEKTASTTRRDRHRPSNNTLTPSASSSSVSSSYSSHSSHSSQNNNNNNSSLSSSSSAPSSANTTPQHSPTTLRPGSPNTRSVSPGRSVSPSRPASPGSPRGESEIQALTRFRFMNRMKSKSSTSIPMASGHTPSPPTSPAATPSKRYHTFSIRKPSPYLQVYQI